MKIFEKAIKDLQEQDIQELLEEKIPEGITLDYKRNLPHEWNDFVRKEFSIEKMTKEYEKIYENIINK